MKFAHIADCHLGGWREEKLTKLGIKAFIDAIDISIKRGVDFILICGDLFNNSFPPIETMKSVAQKLRELKERNIPVYVIAGSHDYSASGKTILDVFESGGLLINVTKGKVEGERLNLNITIDEKTGAKITGILGRKGMLEKKYYEDLNRDPLEKEKGFKIFMFHSAIDELKPEELNDILSFPLSMLPKGFDYYAGGHVHQRIEKREKNYGVVTFPGALFPNNFNELEKFGTGGFFLYEDGSLEWIPVNVCNVYSIKIDCNSKDPKEIENELMNEITKKEFLNTIITIRLFGKLRNGKIGDIDFKKIFDAAYEKGAIFVMKNTTQLFSTEFEGIMIGGTREDIEDKVINENLEKLFLNGNYLKVDKSLVLSLMSALNKERIEGETNANFEKRIVDEVFRIIGIENERTENK